MYTENHRALFSVGKSLKNESEKEKKVQTKRTTSGSDHDEMQEPETSSVGEKEHLLENNNYWEDVTTKL